MQYKNLLNKFVKNVMIGKQYSSAEKGEDLVDIISSKVLYRIANALTDADLLRIEELNKNTNADEVTSYIRQKVPNFDLIVLEEVEVVKKASSLPR